MLFNESKIGTSKIDIRDYTAVLSQHKWFIVVFCMTAMVSSLAITYAISEKYVTGITILFRPVQTTVLRDKVTEVFGSPVPVTPFKIIKQTLRDIAANDNVLRPVVVELGLDKKNEPVYDGWFNEIYQRTKKGLKEGMVDAWTLLKYGRLVSEDPVIHAIIKLRDNINVEATKDSFIYILTVKDSVPKRAVMIADLVGEKIVAMLREEYQEPVAQNVLTFKNNLAQKETEILKLREEKKYILESNGIVSLSDETARGVDNLYEMQLELTQIKSRINMTQKRIDEIEKKLQKGTRAILQAEDYKKLMSDKVFEQIELKGLVAKSDYLQIAIDELEDKLQHFPDLKKKVENLEMDILSAVKGYEHIKDLYTEAFVQLLTARKSFCILHPAALPSKPSQPIKIYHVGLAGFLSLLISISLSYIFDYLNIQLFAKNKRQSREDPQNISVSIPSSENFSGNLVLSDEKSLKGTVSATCYVITGISAMALSALVYYFFKKLGY